MSKKDEPEKIVLRKEEFPSNSLGTKKCDAPVERVKKKKVASARKVRKSLLRRLKDSFKEGEPGHEVSNYVMHDVVIPAAKTTIADLVEGAIEMVLFGGDARTRHVVRNKGRSYVSYSDMYSGGTVRGRGGRPETRRPHNVERATRMRHDFSGVVLGSRAEAEIVMGEMVDLIEQYGVASVSDLYDLVGLSSEYTDNKFGWFDLTGISTMRVRDGWSLELPRPGIIE
jgi:hypothetical protein